MGKTAAIASTSPDPIELLRRARATLRVLEGADGGRAEVLSRLVDRLCEAATRPGARVVRRTSRSETVQDALVAVDAELRRLRRAISGNGSRRRSAATTRAHLFGGRTPVRSKAGYQCEVRTVLAAIATLDEAPPAVLAMVPRLQAVLARLNATSPATPGRRPAGPRCAWSPEVHRAARNLHVALGEVLSEAAATVELHTLERLERIVLTAPMRERKLAKGRAGSATAFEVRGSEPAASPAGHRWASGATGEDLQEEPPPQQVGPVDVPGALPPQEPRGSVVLGWSRDHLRSPLGSGGPKCGSDRRVIEALFEGEAANRILRARGESTEAPVPAPSRDPPQAEVWSRRPSRSDEFVQRPSSDDLDQREAAA